MKTIVANDNLEGGQGMRVVQKNPNKSMQNNIISTFANLIWLSMQPDASHRV